MRGRSPVTFVDVVRRVGPAGLALLLALPAQATLFRLPLDKPDEIWAEWVIHVDHDPADGGLLGADCLAFNGNRGFPFCYDAHDGTDYILYDNWDAMDQERVTVLAAADGWVTSVADGNYDRCHADLGSQDVSCDGHPMIGNHVKLRHADGMETWYWHFKKNSIVVAKDQFVRCGDPLGFVGSSGYSTGPHLHFEVRTADGDWIDPYSGPFSQAESYWVQQDGAFGLPGAYCEGDPIPPTDPGPELGGEDVGGSTDVGASDLGGTAEDVVDASEEARPDDLSSPDAWEPEDVAVHDEGTPPQDLPQTSDPGVIADAAVPGDAGVGFDLHGRLPGASGWGCAAGGGGAAGGLPVMLVLLGLALARGRRRP